MDAQLAAQRVKIDRFKAAYALKKQQVEQLRVRAGVAGMLQQLGNNTPGALPLESGGAFTDAKTDRVGRFELADGGTLFLDELANISPNQQARLLRVLQTRELERVGSSRTVKVDARILSATNAEPGEEVGAGRFRADLLYRLNAIAIHLPPLRERREDIPALASFFLTNYATKYRKAAREFDAAAMRVMLEHDWPRNVRELQHAIERAVLFTQDERIQASAFGLRAPHP